MPSKVPCYLLTHRKKWGLTQKELASLVPRGRRCRVADVERGILPPNARELLAYALIFGSTPQSIFPEYAEEIEDAVTRAAAEFDQRLAKDSSPAAARKIEFLSEMGSNLRLQADDHPNS